MLNLFQKKSIGLDIADHTIEAVELVSKAGKTKILNVGRIKLEPGIVERGRIKNQEKLTEAVRQTFLKAEPKRIIAKRLVFGLPESQVYTHVFDLIIKDKSVAETLTSIRDKLILKEVQESIPLKKEDILFNYKILKAVVLDQRRIKVEILAVAVSREAVSEWQKFFQDLKIEIEFFDIETLAVFRGLFVKPPKEPICIIDMGAVTTTVAIFDRNDLRYSYSINLAGNLLTQKIAEELKVKQEQAEELKIENGLLPPTASGTKAVGNILTKVLEPVVEEIIRLFRYFENKANKKVSEIILVGGSSRLRGLLEYFRGKVDLPVRLGESSLDVDAFKKVKPFLYIEAIGLALRDLNKRKWDKDHPVIKLVEKSGSLRSEESEIAKVETPMTEEGSGEKENLKTYRPEEDGLRKKKIRLQKALLIIILILGIVGFSLALTYRRHEKEQKKREIESMVSQYSQIQIFDLRVPVVVKAEEYTSDRVRGRIIENTIKGAGDYNEARANSKILAGKELQPGEVLWEEPISPEPKELIFPLIIKWLVYSEGDANKILLGEVDKLNKNNVDYALNNIIKTDLEPSDDKDMYFLFGKVTVSINQLIEIKEEEEAESGGEVEKRQKEEVEQVEEQVLEKETGESEKKELVTIQDTEVGWLNIRSGPGTNYSKIGRAYPGENYPLLQEQDGWYKIEVDKETQGWVFSDYAVKTAGNQ